MTAHGPILPGATLGVLGGGQLGKMFVLRAREMGYRTAVFDPDPLAPAGLAADVWRVASYSDAAALTEFGALCDAVTIEFENVPAEALDLLSQWVPVAPRAAAVRVAQDRIREKELFRALGLQTAAFAAVESIDDVERAVAETGLPALLKTARLGYDGKGQARVSSTDEAKAAFRAFGGVPCILESRLPLDGEVSVIVVRSRDGQVACYEPSENVHVDGVLHTSLVPAPILTQPLEQSIREAAARIVEALEYVGIMGVEFFVSDGRVIVNEIAPRPHNSGHWTQDGAQTCQFEQQVRILAGLPIGPLGLEVPTCMINVLGDVWPEAGQPDWPAALGCGSVFLHLYGKAEPRRGRKMGHLNCIAESPGAARRLAIAAWRALHPPHGA